MMNNISKKTVINKAYWLRNKKVIFDFNLAESYVRIETRVPKQAVKISLL